jgi:hypothetical protein
MEGKASTGLSNIRRWKTLAPPEPAPPVAAGESHGLVASLAAAVRCLEKAVTQDAWAVDETGLAESMAAVGRLRALVDRVEVTMVREIVERGTADGSGLSLVDWLVDRQGAESPRPDPRRVASVVAVAAACADREPGGEVIAAAVCSGAMPLRSAARIAGFVREMKPLAEHSTLEADVGVLCAAASDGPDGRGLGDRELARAIRYAAALTHSREGLERDEGRLRQARALWSGPGPAGMTAYRLLLDPEGAAIVDSAVGALSRPVPGPEGEPDLRPAARRRADALLEMIGRGVASGTALPGGAKAQVVVTIALSDLQERVRGAGLTSSGELMSAPAVRRLACDAQILPMVLGGDGEVLDLGRSARLFTPAQRRVVAHRDGHCTYPGCTRDASWCDVHHLRWWSRDGPTDVDNAALLCGRHHTLVHQRDLVGTVDAGGVTWHR